MRRGDKIAAHNNLLMAISVMVIAKEQNKGLTAEELNAVIPLVVDAARRLQDDLIDLMVRMNG